MAGVTGRSMQPTSRWGRLKETKVDPLERFGLPSKGDKRLLNFEAQETYYKEIVERYRKVDRTTQDLGTALDEQMASLNITVNHTPKQLITPSAPAAAQNERDRLLMAMRKLREGMVASNRADGFAVQAYSFCIRRAILAKHMESYHPALLHLLERLHPKVSSSIVAQEERLEFVGYLILDLACRQADYAGAFATRNLYRLAESRINAVLQAMVHGQYHLFWKARRTANIYQVKLMEYVDERMRSLTIRCLERAYFTVDAGFLNDVTGMDWDEFVGKYKVPWERDGQMLVLRRRAIR
ncbi:MAG: hypothetical protein M1816_001522 [Peltula sp. TS41687]|nr:MAG: hypothetical protein M1816_001522 [Peltula sp. TS41687]